MKASAAPLLARAREYAADLTTLIGMIQWEINRPGATRAGRSLRCNWEAELGRSGVYADWEPPRAMEEILAQLATYLAACSAVTMLLQASMRFTTRLAAALRLEAALCRSAAVFWSMYGRIEQGIPVGQMEIKTAASKAAADMTDPTIVADEAWIEDPDAEFLDFWLQILTPYAGAAAMRLFQRASALRRARRVAEGFVPTARMNRYRQAGSVPGPPRPKGKVRSNRSGVAPGSRRAPKDWTPDEAASRVDELKVQGHGPQRHEGQVDAAQHDARVLKGTDLQPANPKST